MKLLFILSFLLSVHSFGQVEEAPVYCGPAIKEETKQKEVYDIVDEPAEYPGGFIELKKFLKDNLVYSKAMIEGGYVGKYYVKFIVDKDGTCRDFRITKVIIDIECPECDKEVLRVLKLMPKWKPGSVNGQLVSSWFRLPIVFNPN